ncbi:glycosyltransferase [Clostridium tagluense]|uniref:tetratricopeptide repeat-containing glycosyltransferase family 2 protein n=1 Tax=Clostridium tagluense TaxID=360422 RepID=UPI001CF307A9|nr:glycosyltransferase [Clostridium tagluense]MCB2312377.1 glycosyltransferase [Clostridium tagluense]MCB2317052.1 glycosyltransferase [Clostridium tagluense]MCB2321921.1 glycosyltransferase [Clostridium tagluense]MCB2326836.1 glycosyltransferase [Clostridium tagluense]MCB2331648.1 glycosyltransferase [Clostridium tagluense]
MKNEVSLCMIVKNEETYLPRCLSSIKDIVDEIIIVDTGSTDRTIDIAKSFGANVHYFKWNNNFSDARNESLKYATKDWILILDGDDELYPEDQENLRDLLTKQLDENAIYYFETLNYYGSTIDNNSITINLNPRLYKNNQGTHYDGEIHNQLIFSENKYNAIYTLIKIHHFGYMNKSIDSKDKRTRNITLLKQQIKKDPDNYFAHFNLGTEYAALDDVKMALEHYYKSYENFEPHNGYSFLLIFRIVFLNYNIKDYDAAFKFINIGLENYPKFTDLYFLKALILKDMNMPTLQIKSLEKCIELGEAPSELKCLYGVGSFKAYYELGNAYLKLKDYDAAYNYYIEAMKSNPDFINPLYSIGHILKNKNTPFYDFKKIIEEFFSDYPKANIIIANLFYTEGFYKTALEYVEKCELAGIIPEDLMLLKANCLVMSGDFNECIKMNNIAESSSSYLYFSMYKVISSILTNNYDNALALLSNFKEDDLSKYNKKQYKVYSQLLNLFTKEPTSVLSEEENDQEYLAIILEICEILLINNKFNELEIAVNLLNLINNKFVLLNLGKLYYSYGYIELAKKEIMRSIKEFEVYDGEGLEILLC